MNSVNFGENKFCGPSVMSAIIGITTDEASAVLLSIIKRHSPRTRKVTGVIPRDLKLAFNTYGFSSQDIEVNGYNVFANLHWIINKGNADGYYIFMVPGHYIAVELNGQHKYICDNRSKDPINVSNSARLGQKVVSIFKVVKG